MQTIERRGEETCQGPKGIPLAFHTYGNRTNAPAVILVHGWMQAEQCWRKQLLTLSQQHYVVTLDLPGHGYSGAVTPNQVSPDLWAHSVRAVLEALRLHDRPVVLVGWSFGGAVINLYMQRYGIEQVAGIVTFGTTIAAITIQDLGGPPVVEAMKMNDDQYDPAVRLAAFYQFQQLLTWNPPSPDEYYETLGYNRMALDNLWHVNISAVMQAFGTGVAQKVYQAGIPLLIVQGKHDAITPLEVAFALQKKVPHAELLVLECGHSAFLEEPEMVNAALLHFLGSLKERPFGRQCGDILVRGET